MSNKIKIGKDKSFEVNDKKEEKKKYKIKIKQEEVEFTKDEKDEEVDLKIDWEVIVDKEGKKVENPGATDKGENVDIKVKLNKGTFSDSVKIEKISDDKEFKVAKEYSGSFKVTFWIMIGVIVLVIGALIWWWIASSKKEDKEEEGL